MEGNCFTKSSSFRPYNNSDQPQGCSSRSVVSDSVTPWTVAHQVSLSFTSLTLLKFMSIESVMPSNHLIHWPPSAALNLSQHQGLFQWVSSLNQVAEILELQFQHQSFREHPGLICVYVYFLPLSLPPTCPYLPL